MLDLPAEIALLVADRLDPMDVFSLQQTCRWLREALRCKTWNRLDILTTMEDETVGLQMIGKQGQLQIGNKNVGMFMQAHAAGELDQILPYIKKVNISEESPFISAREWLYGEGDFATLFSKLLRRKHLPRVSNVTLNRELIESVSDEETALNRILSTEFPTVKLEYALYPCYGLQWFPNGADEYLFERLTHIASYTSVGTDNTVLTTQFALPRSLESFSIQNPNVTIDTTEFKVLFENCTNLHTLDLDINSVMYCHPTNWIPESVTDLFIHVNNEVPETHQLIKKITSPSVERLALVGQFWSVLPTLRFPSLRDLDLSVKVDEHGIPQDSFNKSVSNVISESRLDSITVNFSVEGLPHMIPHGTASTVTRIRVANNWRQNYDCTSRNTPLWAMTNAIKLFPKLDTIEVVLSGLRTDTKLPYLLHMTKVALQGSQKNRLTVRFFAADIVQAMRDEENAPLPCNTLFKREKNVLELDRGQIMEKYCEQSLKTRRTMTNTYAAASGQDSSKYMYDLCDIVEMVLEGR